MQSKWLIKNIKYDYKALSRELELPEEICRCIINRGPGSMKEIREYLNPDITNLHEPTLMKDLDKAVSLIIRAIEEKKPIRLVGDFDIDGSMSIYIALVAFRRCGAVVDYEIPDRIKDGYGINNDIVDEAIRDGIKLIITFDNGIAAKDTVAYAKENGLEVIVTDHHDVPYILDGEKKIQVVPSADAVVNPKQEDCGYPFKYLCGAGVGFKIITRLYERLGVEKEELKKLIPFVSIATVGDIVDLTGENRIIVKYGLELVKYTDNEGLKELAAVSKVDLESLSTYAIGFILGPCFNAAGRLSTAKATIELLFAKGERAKALALDLYELNQTRKAMTSEGVVLAEEEIVRSGRANDHIIVIKLDDVHESLAGIIAGRVKERYYRPTIVLTATDNGLKGSARSIEEYNVFEGLNGAKSYLTRFGGHPMAAGLTLLESDLEEFRSDLNRQSTLTEDDLTPKITIDARLEPGSITEKFVKSLRGLEPFGKGNTKPVFAEKNLLITNVYYMGKEKDHIKLIFDSNGNQIEGVYFFGTKIIADYLAEEKKIETPDLSRYLKNKKCDILYYPDINSYNGMDKIQLKLSEFRLSSS